MEDVPSNVCLFSVDFRYERATESIEVLNRCAIACCCCCRCSPCFYLEKEGVCVCLWVVGMCSGVFLHALSECLNACVLENADDDDVNVCERERVRLY